MVSRSISLLGGRYRLTGELARAASVQRGWDRWLNRQVFIKILASHKIANGQAKGRFIASASALARIEHPNVEALLDYGSTEDGAPYHVMPEAGDDLATLIGNGELSWARARGILLDVIEGVAALHRRRIVHGNIALHSVALVGKTARLVEFGDAEQREHDPTPEDIAADVLGVAALGFTLLTGQASTGRAAAWLGDALARSGAPRRVQAVLVRALTEPQRVTLASLRRELGSRGLFGRVRPIDIVASAAAATMLAIGLWSSVASSEVAASPSAGSLDAGSDGAACPLPLMSVDVDAANQAGDAVSVDDAPASEPEPAPREPAADTPAVEIAEAPSAASQRRFEAARARLQVGSAAQRKAVSVDSQRFELGKLSAEALVERGIDLTHGRPTSEGDPREPIHDGPLRARALFEAACARDYGKGCHMLGVQIAEGMVPDDGAGAAWYYRRGCALDYPRSCAALADLTRAGQIVADADRLDAKACRLAGGDSSYCQPRE